MAMLKSTLTVPRTFFSFVSSCGSLKTFITQKNHLPPISHLCHLHPWSSFPMSHPKSNKRWTENGRTIVGLLFADRCVCFTLNVLYRWKSNKVMCFWFMKDQNATFQSNSTFHLTKSDITLLLRPLPLGYIFSSFGLPPYPYPHIPPKTGGTLFEWSLVKLLYWLESSYYVTKYEYLSVTCTT